MKNIKYYLSLLKDNKSFDKSYFKEYDLYDMQILDSCMHSYKYNYKNNYIGYIVFESHSIFNKCREITEFILFVLKNFKLDKDSSIMFLCNDIDELKNDYFNTIYVYCSVENKNNKAEYDMTLNNIIDNKFDYISINIDIDLSEDRLYDKLEHELTHAYEDLQRQLNNADSLYIKSIKSKYNNLNINDSDSKELKDVKNILYLLDKSEQNGYLAQFDGILGKEKFNHIQKAYNKIYKSKLYKDIKEFSYLVTNKDKETQKLLCNLYRKIYNSSETDNKILKKIYKEWNRFFEHFRRNIYQCICDHIDMFAIRDSNNIGIDNDINSNSNKNLLNKIKNNYIDKYIFIE